MRNLTCFIASAFGYKDVDQIFDKSIRLTLKDLKIKPLRVDRINHNDKIDKKIIDLINQCDFGIVDLTHARPSAYFEAGYLEGLGKGVIYICRKDHFKPKESDTHGNERIHFDLITKNIISWAEPNQQFRNSLQRRVKFITKPIISSLKTGTEEIESKREFAMLSLTERLKVVKEIAIDFLKRKKFREIPNGRFVYNTLRRQQDLAKVEVFDTVLKDDLFYFHFLDPENLPAHAKFYRLFCSLKATPKSRIEKALRLYNPIGNKIYQNGATIVTVIDSIASIFKLKRQLNELTL